MTAQPPPDAAVAVLMPVVYDELRRLAKRYLSRERDAHTIQATALVHEAYVRLAKEKRPQWQGRTHFLAIGAIAMRRILVEHARARAAAKRGGSQSRITLNEALGAEADRPADLLALDAALTALAAHAPRQARVVELRFFGGLTVDETATLLETSPATVKRDWTLARAWLHREVSRERAVGS